MTGPDLDRLLLPRRIAIAGLSARPETWSRAALGILRHGGFDGEVVALRPRQRDVGVPAVDSLAEAGEVDVLLVALPAAGAVDVVSEAAAAGVGATVVYSSGFAEEGEPGRALQDRLAAAAGSMPVLGPNCLGVVSAPGKLRLTPTAFASRELPPGPVALVTQSGAVGFVLGDLLVRRGIGFSYYVSTGNEACLGAADISAALAQRPEVAVVGLYLESVRDVAAYRAACDLVSGLGKHLVVLKVGRTAAATRAALSHTAAVTGEWVLFEAVSADHGATIAADEDAFVEAVHALCQPVTLPPRVRLGVVTMSGGAGAMVADQVAGLADVPELSEETAKGLADLPVPLAGSANPVDLTGMYARYLDRLDDLLRVVAGDESVDALALYFSFGDRDPTVYHRIAASLDALPIPAWLVWSAAPPGEVEALARMGRVFPTIPALVRALASYPREVPAEAVALLAGGPPGGAAPPAGDVAPAGVLSEHEAAPLLASFGLPYVGMAVAGDAGGLVAAVGRASLPAPWVVKVDHTGVAHRAAHGLVELGVANSEELAVAARRLLTRAEVVLAGAGESPSGARLVAEPQLASVGSFSIGARRDEQWGPVVVVGPGGARVEEAGAERRVATVPLTAAGLSRLLDSAAAAGGADLDSEWAARAILAVAHAVEDLSKIVEVDVNPVLVLADGSVRAVDSLVVAGR
ncbi:MAG: acetate--CoA ligase family protein [Acidimicrobiales bacterium]